MRTIPHRLSGSAGLTYVAHCGCSADAPHRAAAAFLDDKDRWRHRLSVAPAPTPLAAYLALMREILEAVAAESERAYVHFYPADAEIARTLKEALHEERAELGAPESQADWICLREAYYAQRCGCAILGQSKGMSTGTAAVLRALAGEPEPTAGALHAEDLEVAPLPEPGPDDLAARESAGGATPDDLFG